MLPAFSHPRSSWATALLLLTLAVPARAQARLRNRTGEGIWVMPVDNLFSSGPVPNGEAFDLNLAPEATRAARTLDFGGHSVFVVLALERLNAQRIDCALMLTAPGPQGELAPWPNYDHVPDLVPAAAETGPDGHPIRVWDFRGRLAAGDASAPLWQASAAGVLWPRAVVPPLPAKAGPALGMGSASVPALVSGPVPPALPGPPSWAPSRPEGSHALAWAGEGAPPPLVESGPTAPPPFLALDRDGRIVQDLEALGRWKDLRGMVFMAGADLSKFIFSGRDLEGADPSETLLLSDQIRLLHARGHSPSSRLALRQDGADFRLPEFGPTVGWCREYKRFVSYFQRTGNINPRQGWTQPRDAGLQAWKLKQGKELPRLQAWQIDLLRRLPGMLEDLAQGPAMDDPSLTPAKRPRLAPVGITRTPPAAKAPRTLAGPGKRPTSQTPPPSRNRPLSAPTPAPLLPQAARRLFPEPGLPASNQAPSAGPSAPAFQLPSDAPGQAAAQPAIAPTEGSAQLLDHPASVGPRPSPPTSPGPSVEDGLGKKFWADYWSPSGSASTADVPDTWQAMLQAGMRSDPPNLMITEEGARPVPGLGSASGGQGLTPTLGFRFPEED